MQKFMTKQEREKISNRMVLNFGIVLCGALIMLYVYNFVSAGYITETQNTVGIIGILAAITAVVFFILGMKGHPKMKNYSGLFLGAFITALVTYAPRISFVTNLIPAFTAKSAIIVVFLLLLAYFVVFAIVNGIILKTHPEAPAEKKKIQHAKGKKKRKENKNILRKRGQKHVSF